MERQGRPRRRPEAPSAPTTLHEITRRYVATALALSKAMGLPLTETFMREHRESISCCFIEAGRAGVRLPPAVTLPPLAQPHGPLAESEALSDSADGHPVAPVSQPVGEPEPNGTPEGEFICGMTPDPALEPSTPTPPTNGPTPPTVVPKDAGLPCAGQLISDLKPPALMMVINRLATLTHAEGERWVPLLGALQAERGRRLEKRRKPPKEGTADGT